MRELRQRVNCSLSAAESEQKQASIDAGSSLAGDTRQSFCKVFKPAPHPSAQDSQDFCSAFHCMDSALMLKTRSLAGALLALE